MERNVNFKQWFNVFLIISKEWQGYESKAYGVSTTFKLQSKNVSRSSDICNFPTQVWADTAFCTSNWSETYAYKDKYKDRTLPEKWEYYNVSCWCCDSIVVPYARGGRFDPFKWQFVPVFSEFKKNHLGKTLMRIRNHWQRLCIKVRVAIWVRMTQSAK